MTDLPAGWGVATIEELAGKPQYGWTSSASHRASGVHLLRTTDITSGPVHWADVPRCNTEPEDVSRYLLAAGDILVSRAGSVGFSTLLTSPPPRSVFASYLMRLRVRRGVTPKYLSWFLQSPQYWRNVNSMSTGNTIANINGSKLARLLVPVPPTSEQHHIVEVLEDHLSRLDSSVSVLTAVPPRVTGLRLAILTTLVDDMYKRGITGRRIDEISETALGKMLDAKRAVGEDTPYLRNINVRWGSVDRSDVAVVPLSEPERQRFSLVPGDLLVCEGGEPGRCAVWDGAVSGMTYQKALHRVRVRDSDKMEPGFVAMMLEQAVRSGRVASMLTGTTIKHLPQERLRAIVIPVPDRRVQVQLMHETTEAAADAGRAQAAASVASARAGALRRALLQAAFTGRLTGRSFDGDVVEATAAADEQIPVTADLTQG